MTASRRPGPRRVALVALAASGVVSSVTFAGDAPTLRSIEGGLRASNLRFTTVARGGGLAAYPLVSPPVAGFTPLVAVTLTDQQGPDDLSFYAIRQTSRVGNAFPLHGSGNAYTYLATLDSGGQSHILSGADAAAVDIAGSPRAGGYDIEVTGASGSEFLAISDPLGVFVSGVNNVNSVPGAALGAPTSSYRGQVHTSVLTAESGSVLPSIIGVPMLGQYAVNIRNSQTRRIVKPDGTAVRSPNVEFVNHGAGVVHQFKLSLRMEDSLGAASADPAFFPSFGDLENFSNDPGAPTFWSFPIANANVQHAGGSLSQQAFLFDTGAQVTVLSEETADSVGFDVATDEPDFTVDILGVGGTTQAKGFFLERLALPVTGGDAVFLDVPVIVLNVVDPRTGSGVIPGILGMNLFTDRDLTLDLNKSGESFARFGAPITPQWTVNGNGAWLPDANWALGVPDGPDVPANFLGAITAARTITVDGNYTIGSVTFDNESGYTLAGTGRLTFASLGRPSRIDARRGSHTVASPLTFDARQDVTVAAGATLTLSGDVAGATSAVTKSGAGRLRIRDVRLASLALAGGTTQFMAGSSDVAVVGALAISAGASLDVTDRRLIVDYAAASPLATIRADLAAGRIASTLATASTAVGYGEASALNLASFGGEPVDASAVVLRLTLRGDATLDGRVGFADLVALAQRYQQSGRSWTDGDFDYDGVVAFADLVALAQNYNAALAGGTVPASASADFGADWALARSLVPEPTSLLAIAAVATLATRRRRAIDLRSATCR